MNRIDPIKGKKVLTYFVVVFLLFSILPGISGRQIQDITLTKSVSTYDVSPDLVNGTTFPFSVFRFSLENGTGTDWDNTLNWVNVTFNTVDGTMDPNKDIGFVRVYNETDGVDNWTAGDQYVEDSTWTNYDGNWTCNVTSIGFGIPQTTTKNNTYLVVNLTSNAENNSSFELEIKADNIGTTYWTGSDEDHVTTPVRIDKKAPIINIHSPVNQYYSGYMEVNTTIVDDEGNGDNSTYKYNIDDGEWKDFASNDGNTYLSEVFTLDYDDGEHNLTVIANDTVKNTNQKNTTFWVDNTAPSHYLKVREPNYTDGTDVYILSDTPINITAEDSGCGVNYTEYRIDYNDWRLYSGEFSFNEFNITENGKHTTFFGTYDIRNNYNYSSLELILDNSAPTTHISTDGNTYRESDTIYLSSYSDTIFSLTSGDNSGGTGVRNTYYEIDQTTYEYKSPFTVPGGTNEIEFYSEDKIGNSEMIVSKKVNISLDINPPNVWMDLSKGPVYYGDNYSYITGETIILLDGSDTKSGLQELQYIVDGGTWVEYQPFTINSEGNHNVSFKGIDNLGNSKESNDLVYVDKTPPSTHVSVNGSYYWDDSELNVQRSGDLYLSASDSAVGVDTIEYRIDQGIWSTWTHGDAFPSLQEGIYTLSYRSTDHLGNEEEINTITLQVDSGIDDIQMTVGDPKHSDGNFTYVSPETLIELSSTETDFHIRYSFNRSSWFDYSAPFSIPAKESRVYYNITDGLGNEETGLFSERFKVDSSPPTISIKCSNSVETSMLYINQDSEILLETEDETEVDDIKYSMDNSSWVQYSPFSISSEGKHLIEFSATDVLGNTVLKNITIYVDSSAPTTNIDVGTPSQIRNNMVFVTKETDIELTSEDIYDGVGVDTINYRIDSGEWRIYNEPLSVQDEGQYKIEFYGYDMLSNQELINERVFVVDNSPPVVDISLQGSYSDDGNSLTVGPKTMFSLTAQDEHTSVSRIEYSLDGGNTWKEYTIPFSVKEAQDTIMVRARDDLNNVGDPFEKTFTFDNKAPRTDLSLSTFKEVNGISYITHSTRLNVLSTGSEEPTQIEYKINNQSGWYDYESGKLAPGLLKDGLNTLTLKSTDEVGNSAEKSYKIYMDTSIPSITVDYRGDYYKEDGIPHLKNGGNIKFIVEDNIYNGKRTTTDSKNVLANSSTLYYRLDGGDWEKYTGEPIELDKPGQHKLEYKVIDWAGRSSQDSVKVHQDKNGYSGLYYVLGVLGLYLGFNLPSVVFVIFISATISIIFYRKYKEEEYL